MKLIILLISFSNVFAQIFTNGSFFLPKKEHELAYFYFTSYSIPYVNPSDSLNENLRIATTKYRGQKDWHDFGIVYNPNWNLRDPSVVKYNKKYYVAYTRGATIDGTNYFTIVQSDSLLSGWGNEKNIYLTNLGYVKRTWAPEWILHEGDYYIVLSKMSSDWKLQLYYMQLTDWDSLTFTEPLKINVLGKNNIIDGDIIKKDSVFYLFYKDFNTQFFEIATSDSMFGDYTPIKTGNWIDWAYGTEGYDIHYNLLDDGYYTIYVDNYLLKEGYSTSTDLLNWNDFRKLNLDGGHGNILRLQ